MTLPIRLPRVSLVAVLLAVFLSGASLLRADDAVDASDMASLKAKVGQTVDVKGTPTGVGHSKTGSVLYLNFSHRPHDAVSVVFFQKGERGVTEEDLQKFVGKTVTINGTLAAYKDDVQIVLQSADQIKTE